MGTKPKNEFKLIINPYEEVGILHNEGLSCVFKDL